MPDSFSHSHHRATPSRANVLAIRHRARNPRTRASRSLAPFAPSMKPSEYISGGKRPRLPSMDLVPVSLTASFPRRRYQPPFVPSLRLSLMTPFRPSTSGVCERAALCAHVHAGFALSPTSPEARAPSFTQPVTPELKQRGRAPFKYSRSTSSLDGCARVMGATALRGGHRSGWKHVKVVVMGCATAWLRCVGISRRGSGGVDLGLGRALQASDLRDSLCKVQAIRADNAGKRREGFGGTPNITYSCSSARERESVKDPLYEDSRFFGHLHFLCPQLRLRLVATSRSGATLSQQSPAAGRPPNHDTFLFGKTMVAAQVQARHLHTIRVQWQICAPPATRRFPCYFDAEAHSCARAHPGDGVPPARC
ncbi:hypothetical protein HETIRDRAFT_100202 [Heterobasidion irregulare TC 32-1]|uniref:Uncharacterized protein n=1 Tax=Heterobasidion irregulare (strain TC 32-1) TaxID=747525 RepID=W4KLR7_HETIT|nr:uncharacterized protein HETIRDRAFT_100202 [Heterobasidion irregulare TC 32-1]ETW86295.1 hypothetical protein HETIRDRAFT_100202 [Heterobasidion irregulare TC 32-1]